MDEFEVVLDAAKRRGGGGGVAVGSAGGGAVANGVARDDKVWAEGGGEREGTAVGLEVGIHIQELQHARHGGTVRHGEARGQGRGNDQ